MVNHEHPLLRMAHQDDEFKDTKILYQLGSEKRKSLYETKQLICIPK